MSTMTSSNQTGSVAPVGNERPWGVIAEFDSNTKHVLVHTGQNYDYELNQLFFEDLNIRKPNYFLESGGNKVAQTIARVIEKSDDVMEQEQPDAVMLYGDTNSCLAVISA